MCSLSLRRFCFNGTNVDFTRAYARLNDLDIRLIKVNRPGKKLRKPLLLCSSHTFPMAQNSTLFQHPSRLLWLIFACLLLLGVSQVLWIKRVWNEQKDGLRQETNFIFQQTVMTLQDSLVRRSTSRNGQPISLPSMPLAGEIIEKSVVRHLPPPVNVKKRFEIRREFSRIEATPPAEKGQVQVYITTSDTQQLSWQRGLGRVLLNVKADSLADKTTNLVFEIRMDSISMEELQVSYAAALDSADLPKKFTLRSASTPSAFNADKPKPMVTEPALAGLVQHHFFQAEFNDYQGYLVQKILPYCLFSLLLLGLTSLAFWLIFNNLKQQKKLAQQKNEFISNVTHELKTPLTTVGVALEALSDFEVLRDPEKTKEYLRISTLELDRLNLLVNKVLRLSMFEQQALQLRPETVDLAAATQQVIAAMTLQANSVGANIRFSTDHQPFWVRCDRLHLTGVVYNLLDNALKYRCEKPEIDVSIEKATRDGRDFVRLQVADNGIGIAPEFQTSVFEKFFRVPVGDTHNVKGHGLGLSYVLHVAREHGGQIRVESTPGKGSVFTLEIPVGALPPTA